MPILLSGALHAGIIFALPQSRSVRVRHLRGDSAVELTLVPSEPARRNPPNVEEQPPVGMPDLMPAEAIEKESVMERDPAERDFYSREADFSEIPDSDLPAPEKSDDVTPEPEPEPQPEPEHGPESEPERPPLEEPEPDREQEREDTTEEVAVREQESEERLPPDPEEKLVEEEEDVQEDARDPHDAPESPGDVREEGVRSGVEERNLPRPEYPRLARRRGWEGAVTLLLRVNEQGVVTDTELIESSGYAVLDDAARDAAGKAHFEPAERAGVSVSSSITLTYRFRLEDIR